MKKILYLILTFILLYSCNVEPKPISYGNDKCEFCTMTIVDKPYGTEVVTDKGKVFKFDSTECMLNFIDENDATYPLKLTNTMDQPGELTDALTSYYLISENLPSPMGANITAFSTQTLAEDAQVEFGGVVLDFNKLLDHHSKETSRAHKSGNH